MEYTGIELDTKYLGTFAAQVDDLISDYEQQIYGYANQNSISVHRASWPRYCSIN